MYWLQHAHFNLPNSATWVTSIFYKWLRSRPWGFTPKVGKGKYCGHVSYWLTTWWAISFVKPNCFLNLLLFWWCKACDRWASSTCYKAITRLNLSVNALPSASGPGRFECVLIWPTKHGNFPWWMASWICQNSTLTWLLLVSMQGAGLDDLKSSKSIMTVSKQRNYLQKSGKP